jgi:NAD(P)H-dependent FMN reductase
MRPLFAFFGAEVMVSGIYAGKADIDEHQQMSPTLQAAVDAAVQQAVRALGRTTF